MMAQSNWGNRIDLTQDSDSDAEPLDSLSSTIRSQPRKTPIPLPNNVRHLYSPATAPQPTQLPVALLSAQRTYEGYGPANQTLPYNSPYASAPSAATFHASAPIHGQSNGIEYVEIFPNNTDEDVYGFAHRQAEKRRRTRAPTQTHFQAGSGASSDGDGHRSSALFAESPLYRYKAAGTLSNAECHFLIFLKEVKKLQWKVLTEQFCLYYPGRKYTTLQSYYSTKLNKRDRSKDPATFTLPPGFDTEAVIDSSTVHAMTAEPAVSETQDREATTRNQIPQRQSEQPLWATTKPVDHFQDYSSGAEYADRRERPRRTVPIKNYTWPKKHDHLQADEESDSEEVSFTVPFHRNVSGVSEEPLNELQLAAKKAVPVDNNPVGFEFEREDAGIAITTIRRHNGRSKEKLPYLSLAERSSVQHDPGEWEWDQLDSRNWQGSTIHVDFSPVELDVVERAVAQIVGSPLELRSHSRRRQLQAALRNLTEPKLLRTSSDIHKRLPTRDRKSIAAFLQDAKDANIRIRRPRVERLAAARPTRDNSSEQKTSTSAMLRQRELGLQSRRGWNAASRPLSYQLKNKIRDSLGSALSYTGASSDVHAVAWSVDGHCFAAGAICVDDPHSMQYNKPNNLLYGDVSYRTIHELGEHAVDRPKPMSGPNSTHAMHASQDPRLYKTVSSVAFSPNGRLMFSGGYDQHVCLWDIKADGSQPELLVAMKHKAQVDMMAVNRNGLLATASKKWGTNAIKVIDIPEDNPMGFDKQNFSSQKATTRPDHNILPTALQFSPRSENLLLAGFGANVRNDGRDMNGDICLWDVNAQQQLTVHGSGKNVFDLSFHPRQRWFAVGCVAGQSVNRGTRSIVRLYDDHDLAGKYRMRMELECKALDMNDIVWCPGDDFLVAAGCTSGRAYVWDVRWPDDFLRELAHSQSLMPLDEYINHEITDTGIRFLSWGDNATRLYTGSSDGVVKVWNVARSEEETFVKDLVTLDSGIMSGAFSPDKSRLILGEVNGSINVLEVGRDDCLIKDTEKFKYISYDEPQDETEMDIEPTIAAGQESGIAIAAELFQSRQMMQEPLGGLPIRQAVQGPNYVGPFDSTVDAPFLREQALEFQHNISRSPGPQCSIPLCTHGAIKITDEETGDSGRSADRIPDELRQQWKVIGSSLQVVPGKSRCRSCGRSARPSQAEDGLVLCERCSFACFRCGAVNRIPPATETLVCTFCARAWDIGALGYKCIKDNGRRTDVSDVPFLTGYRKDILKKQALDEEQSEDNATFGDEMNALTDYYFGLAIDRPESPPL